MAVISKPFEGWGINGWTDFRRYFRLLLLRLLILTHRIRKLAEQVDGFNSGTAEMLDVALQEDELAQLHNGIADLQQALARA